jgi:hypothetical protein
MKRLPALLCHCSFWCVTVFATPLYIGIRHGPDVAIPILQLGYLTASTAAVLTALTFGASALCLSPAWRQRSALIMLGCALVLAIQAVFVHGLFEYAASASGHIDFRSRGHVFWYEWTGFLFGLAIITGLLLKLKPQTPWLPLLPMVVALALPLSTLPDPSPGGQDPAGDMDTARATSGFSRNGNVIHLLPGGLQSDIAQQVLENDPELASRLRGFTFFANHLGLYPDPEPSVSTILTGESFPLERGYDTRWVNPYLFENGYPARLKQAGYRIDMVPLKRAHCPPNADSCRLQLFGTVAPRGDFDLRHGGLGYSIDLVADLSLFQMSPMWLKEKIYNNGHWLLSGRTTAGYSPTPDPLIREWVKNMHVVDGPRVYKWYHYVNTPSPPRWDNDCALLGARSPTREHYEQQGRCILRGVAELVEALEHHGIYEQTSIVVSSDHGSPVTPAGATGDVSFSGLGPSAAGASKPVFMAKPAGAKAPLRFSMAPTALIDIEPTVMWLAGLAQRGDGLPALEISEFAQRARFFNSYDSPVLADGSPVPHEVYRVEGDVNDGRNWKLAELVVYRSAPSIYSPVNRSNAEGFFRGLRFVESDSGGGAAWVEGNRLIGLISAPGGPGVPHVLRLALHQPHWLPENQADVFVNGHMVGQQLAIRVERGYWTELAVEIPAKVLRQGNNFVEVQFAKTGKPPESRERETATLIQSVWLSPLASGSISKP